jgi:hypothetical protein
MPGVARGVLLGGLALLVSSECLDRPPGRTSERLEPGVLVLPSRRAERQTWMTPWSKST